ncbi:MAG: DUF3006 family protein [Thermoanaerobacteraceae bacterium]
MKKRNIKGILDKIYDNNAVILIDDDERTVIIPINYLTSNVSEGDIVEITISSDKEEKVLSENKFKKFTDKILDDN